MREGMNQVVNLREKLNERALADRYERAAEKALALAEKYRQKGDSYLAEGNRKRAEKAYDISERKLLKAQTAMCFIRD